MTVSFFVAGIPKPGGSKRVFPIRRGGVPTGRFVVTDDSGLAGRNWRTDVKDAALKGREFEPVLRGPLSLTVTFNMPRPAGHFGSGRNADRVKPNAPQYPAVKPDVTKLVRAIEDALTGVLWRDDAQIVEQHAQKLYTIARAQPGASVCVEEFT